MRVNTAGHAHSRFTQSWQLRSNVPSSRKISLRINQLTCTEYTSDLCMRVNTRRPRSHTRAPKQATRHASETRDYSERLSPQIPSHFPTHIDRYAPRSAYLSPHTHLNSRNAPVRSWPSQGLIRQRGCAWETIIRRCGGHLTPLKYTCPDLRSRSH